MRVLIIDDNEELREFLALSLTEAAIEAVVANDPEDALRKIENEKFDVLIIDSVMEGGDGIELTQQIRATRAGKNVPILLMSSMSTALARRMAKSVGCNEFLVKPFGTLQFVEQVRTLVR
jgi:DNA-binding response OmpR family regulator